MEYHIVRSQVTKKKNKKLIITYFKKKVRP